jgi:hypothetical protein
MYIRIGEIVLVPSKKGLKAKQKFQFGLTEIFPLFRYESDCSSV